MGFFSLLLTGWFVLAVVMTVLWYYQKIRGEADIVDAGWAACIGFLSLYYAYNADGYVVRRFLVGILASVWAFRLAWYLFVNRVLKKGEDGRYQTLRAKWGQFTQRNFFIFFQAQALLAVFLSIPFLLICKDIDPSLRTGDVIGMFVWFVAVGGEVLADTQLSKFRSDPSNQGKTCREGLWRYSRHPNYFFEWVHWWSYVCLGWGSPFGWWAIVNPFLMLHFILNVTGVPPTEARALESRGEDYRAYQRTTSAFFPWFPKEEK